MNEKAVAYAVNGRQFKGMLVYDDSAETKRPAIFSQPDWKGVCNETIAQAREVAAKGYVVLLADMFGADYGDKPKTRDDFMKAARAVRTDFAFIKSCGDEALEALSVEADRLGLIEPNNTFAIGYCVGGGVLLEQARAGADFKATVVFHVTMPNPIVADTPCGFTGRVLTIHGAADVVTPKPMMDALEQELTAAKVDWQSVLFGRGLHSFCDPGANDETGKYDAQLCRKSYRLMQDFFKETL